LSPDTQHNKESIMAVTLTINGKKIEAREGTTVLEAARANGITIPTLCYHKDLSPAGSCRLCMVEVKGWRGQVAACTLEVSAGMAVQTETPDLAAARRTILGLLLQNYVDADGAASDSHASEFMSWVRKYAADFPLSPTRIEKPAPDGFPAPPRFRVDSDPNPFVRVDLNKCILCTRCVRACAEIQGRFVWGIGGRGHESHLIAGADTSMLEARCESCGACVAYCPTGALDNRLSFGLGFPDKVVTTTCTYCGVGCQLDLNVKDGQVIRVTSNPAAPVNGMHLCVKGRYGYDFIHHPERLVKPRVREYLLENHHRPQTADCALQGSGDLRSTVHGRPSNRGNWVEVDWDTALNITTRKLRQARDTSGPDSVGVLTSAKCLNEENYLMNKFARQVIGTHNIDHCARL
jgi:formate dehydrogenase major subunit/formate dehydrogenase alpha subunit